MEMAPTVYIRWVPEDDLLLKNAVEAGASLEALAKGAVQFSRKYTLQELQERWHSLLYDPDISSLASAHMFELEISGISPPKLNRSDNFLGNKEVSVKRKSESIRRKYYAMRKRYRAEFFNNSDHGFFEPNHQDFIGQDADFLEEEDLDILRQAFPETIPDISVAPSTSCASQTGCPDSFEENKRDGVKVGYEFDKKVTSTSIEGGNDLDVNMKNAHALRSSVDDENREFEGRQQPGDPHSDGYSFQRDGFASDLPQLRHCRTVGDSSTPTVPVRTTVQNDYEGKENNYGACTGEFVDPDSLLNLSNEDDIDLVDIDENHGSHKHCSALDGGNNDVRENEAPKAEHETVIVPEARMSPDANPVILGSHVSTAHVDNQTNIQPVLEAPSTLNSNYDLANFTDGKTWCVLNTEITEVPCNDDIFLLIHTPTSFDSFTQPTTLGLMSASADTHAEDDDLAVNLRAENKELTQAFGWPQKVGPHDLPELNSLQGSVGREAQDSRTQVLPRFSNKSTDESSKGRPLYEIQKLPDNRLFEKEVAGVDTRVEKNLATASDMIRPRGAGNGRTPTPKPAPDTSASYHEESQIEDDVPFFSDIEAMVLEMDLDPHDQDSNILRDVSSFQYDETKRTIIRLEQGARSCLQRAMTSQGALAMLYGRHLRHYIKKPEVLLGRSTEDVEVDIDLRREGRANKISRRQAIIKLEADGAFFLKNLGKSVVYVNGTTLATGQFLKLSSTCLIEIKGMSFVFEINEGYVKKHLGNFCLKNKREDG